MIKENLSKIKNHIKLKDEINSSFSKTYDVFEDNVYKHYNIKQIEKKYFVSIIMPTFNRKNIISKAIDSVLNQYFKNFELIIVDDGSDDSSEGYVKEKYREFIESDSIKYFKLNHQGVSAARNFGLEQSSGNIIAYLDSDNQWHENYLYTMLSRLEGKKEYNCAYCNVKITNQNTNREYILNYDFNRKKILKSSFIDLNGFIHKKQLYDKLGGFDEELSRLVDWDLIIRYTENNNPLHVNKTLVSCFLSSKLNNIAYDKHLKDNMERIHHKYWMEIYSDEYNAIKDYFDPDFYLKKYEDVLNSDLNPIYHFLTVGHNENRNPNEEFNTQYYKNRYPEVVRFNLNPLVHYAKWGKKEGRKINYFKKPETIINNNLMFLSNYEFDYEPLVSIIILNRNGLSHLKNLFKDFSKKTNYSNYEIIVVDNASEDDSVKFLKDLKELNIKIIENKENVSFSKGNNEGVKISNGEYVLLLNNDIEPTYGWLNELMGTIVYGENVGAVGAKLIYPYLDDYEQQKYSFTIQHAGDIIREKINNGCLYQPENLNKYSPKIYDNSISVNRKCILVTGAVLLTKKDIYLEVGGLDEGYWYGYEDVDFNLKLYEKGYDVIFASAALLLHHESATPKKAKYTNNHDLLCNKWGKFLFKKLLKDKLDKNYFFTDKPMHFLFVHDSDFMQNRGQIDTIHRLATYLNDMNYNTSLNLDISDLNVDSDVDVLVSFTQNYDIKNVVSRKNLIKTLILDNESNVKENLKNWDIILWNDNNKVIAFTSNNKFDYKNLNEAIISSLYDTFLNE